MMLFRKNDRRNAYLDSLSFFETTDDPRKLVHPGARELKPITLKTQGIPEPDALFAQRLPDRLKGLDLIHRDFEVVNIQVDAWKGLDPIAARSPECLKI